MANSAKNVCLPLPNTITNIVTTYEDREQFLVKYLEKELPSSDSKNVLEELKRTFILDKHKAWRKPNKPESVKCKSRLKKKASGLKKKIHKGTYKDYMSLHKMWVGYMKQNLNCVNFENLPTSPLDSGWESISQRLLKADYQGALISVVRSKHTATVGMKGIVVQETKNVFRIVTPINRLITLPKESSVFKIHLPNDASLEVFGHELRLRPSERSVKKFKANHFGYL